MVSMVMVNINSPVTLSVGETGDKSCINVVLSLKIGVLQILYMNENILVTEKVKMYILVISFLSLYA